VIDCRHGTEAALLPKPTGDQAPFFRGCLSEFLPSLSRVPKFTTPVAFGFNHAARAVQLAGIRIKTHRTLHVGPQTLGEAVAQANGNLKALSIGRSGRFEPATPRPKRSGTDFSGPWAPISGTCVRYVLISENWLRNFRAKKGQFYWAFLARPKRFELLTPDS
jgi:hypothetical protein